MVTTATSTFRAFDFEKDSFHFAHELVWQYRFDPATGAMTTFDTVPPPTYYHRCFVMVRSTRQFYYHARFDPDLPAATPESCRKLVREVVSRNPRRADPGSEKVIIPGFDGLRSFSRAHESLLKSELGSAWQSYFVRSHWRMVFPVVRHHQKYMSGQLLRSLRKRGITLVHLFRFPHITINHGIVLFAASELEKTIEYEAYDPNIPAHPVKLIYERDRRRFVFPPSIYWGGGPLKVIEIYRGGFF